MFCLWCRGAAVWVLIGVSTSSAQTTELPNCTFEDGCPQCLADAVLPAARRTVRVTQETRAYYSAVRIGRRSDNTAQALTAHIFGLLTEERAGTKVTYLPCRSGLACSYAVNRCVGWAQETCAAVFSDEASEAAQAQGKKVFPDPLADIWFVSGTSEDYQGAHYYQGTGVNPFGLSSTVLGSIGYVEDYGVYAFPEMVSAVRQTSGLDIDSFEAFSAEQARQPLHSPAELDAFGVQPLTADACDSNDTKTQASMQVLLAQGWTCDGVWWLNPTCAALGGNWSSQCLAVIDDSWEQRKASLWRGLARSGVPVAKQVVSADSWWQVVYLSQQAAMFIWSRPSDLLQHRHPTRLALRDADEPAAEITVKVGWTTGIAAAGVTRLSQQMRVNMETLAPVLLAASEARAAGHADRDEDLFYRKLACDWVRTNEHLWSTWKEGSSCRAGYAFDEASQECQVCLSGTRQATHPENGTAYCYECPAGRRSAGPVGACQLCTAGTYNDITRQRSCKPCPVGRAAPDRGQTTCEACVAGKMGPGEGTQQCLDCGPGFASTAGSSQCEACVPGKYANGTGSQECTSCGPGLVTLLQGARQASECVCQEDSLREVGSLTCSTCPNYFRCRPGSSLADFANGDVAQLSLQPGYMSRLEDPLQIYRCSPPDACPGIKPGSCGPNRDPNSVACGRGLPDTYEDDDGFHKCTSQGSDGVVLALIVLGGIMGLLIFSFAISRDFQDQTNAGLLVTALCGVSFSAFQTMGMFNSLSVIWFEPLKTIFSIISLVSLDLRYLHLGCLTPVSPITTYATRQMVAPCSIPVMLMSLLMKKCWKRPVDLFPEFVNVVGAVFTLFFTSIIISSATPFICYPHPVGGKSSMVSETSILCFEDSDHWGLVTIGIISFLVISVPFLAVSTYGTLKYPMLLASPMEKHTRMLRAFRFLYLRFKPQCHFYGLIMSLRSVCICLVPVLPGVRGDAALQFCFLSAIITTFIMIQLWLQPWRSFLANIADGVLMNCNLQLLVCAAISTTFTDTLAIGKFGTVVFCVFAILVIGGCIAAARWYLIPTPFYNHFICHHKGGAAAQARLLKIHLQELSKTTVFIDSDDLKELDKLFDIVKTKVGQLVVYLTRETLMRPWCAGEVCTAIRAKKKVLVIRTPGFVDPTDLELQNIRSYIDLTGCNLSQYGIQLEDVACAFRELLSESTPHLELPSGGTSRWMAAANSVLKRGKLKEPTVVHTERSNSPSKSSGAFVISADPNSDESCASAAIVEHKMRSFCVGIAETTPLMCLSDFDQQELRDKLEYVAQARSVCVLLSAGSLTCVEQVFVMVQLTLQEGTDIIPVRLPGFQFPEDAYFSGELHEIWPGTDKALAEAQMRAFFKRIAVKLEIAGSDTILNRQIDEISSRVRTGKLSLRTDVPAPVRAALDCPGGAKERFRNAVELVQRNSKRHDSSLKELRPTAPQASIQTRGEEMLWPGHGVDEQVSAWRAKRTQEAI